MKEDTKAKLLIGGFIVAFFIIFLTGLWWGSLRYDFDCLRITASKACMEEGYYYGLPGPGVNPRLMCYDSERDINGVHFKFIKEEREACLKSNSNNV